MKIGYARVSSQDQNLKLQSDELQKFGCEVLYKEKVSGKNKERPELLKLIEHARKGDTVVVWKLDRLGRSLRDLIDLVIAFRDKGIAFVSLKDNIDTTSAMGKFTFNLFASLAEFEREIIRERTMVGLTAAKARGRTGGRKPGLGKDAMSKAKAVKTLFDMGDKPMEEIAITLGISRATAYRYLDVINGMTNQNT